MNRIVVYVSKKNQLILTLIIAKPILHRLSRFHPQPQLCFTSIRRYMDGILRIGRKTKDNQSIKINSLIFV